MYLLENGTVYEMLKKKYEFTEVISKKFAYENISIVDDIYGVTLY